MILKVPSTNNNNPINKTNHTMIQAIHTAVKGRARYKINGLYQSEALKNYLELKLSQQKTIEQVHANPLTGNILITFHPQIHQNTIATLIKEVISQYRKSNIKLLQPSTKQSREFSENGHFQKQENIIPNISSNLQIQKQLKLAQTQFPITGISALFLSTAILYRLGLDERILFGIENLHSPLLHSIMLTVTLLGEPTVLLLLCLGLRSWLLQSNRRQEANILGIAAVGAIGFNYILKLLFARVRPMLWDRIIHVGHHSFPSGHAMVSIVVYGYIGYILAQQFPQYQKQISIFTMALIAAIGFSRLYLGVHWLTDVTAGYAAGLIWLVFCISKLESQQRYNAKSLINTNNFASSQIRLQFIQ
jgi:membrane-associated phospholipid phosphatase